MTLCGDQFAPVTWAMGFLRAPLDVVTDALQSWRRDIHGSAQADRRLGGLREHVLELEPLTGGVMPRELVVATQNPEWTALFGCGIQGGDAVSTVGHLSRTLQCQGLALRSIAHRARQFEMFGPIRTDFLNYVRTISVTRDGGRWRFDAAGTVQDFEEVEAYSRTRVAERFTPPMLADYCAAVGLRPFEEDFFPGPSVLVRNPAVPPPGGLVLSIRDAQAHWSAPTGLDPLAGPGPGCPELPRGQRAQRRVWDSNPRTFPSGAFKAPALGHYANPPGHPTDRAGVAGPSSHHGPDPRGTGRSGTCRVDVACGRPNCC